MGLPEQQQQPYDRFRLRRMDLLRNQCIGRHFHQCNRSESLALLAPTGTVAVVDLEVTEIMSSSAHSNANSDGDWFEIRNNGSTSVDLNGYSWDNSSQTAGTYTFGNYVLPAGQSLIVLDEDSSSIQEMVAHDCGQTANSIRVIATRHDRSDRVR